MQPQRLRVAWAQHLQHSHASCLLDCSLWRRAYLGMRVERQLANSTCRLPTTSSIPDM